MDKINLTKLTNRELDKIFLLTKTAILLNVRIYIEKTNPDDSTLDNYIREEDLFDFLALCGKIDKLINGISDIHKEMVGRTTKKREGRILL